MLTGLKLPVDAVLQLNVVNKFKPVRFFKYKTVLFTVGKPDRF
jgi:hypothetical protein